MHKRIYGLVSVQGWWPLNTGKMTKNDNVGLQGTNTAFVQAKNPDFENWPLNREWPLNTGPLHTGLTVMKETKLQIALAVSTLDPDDFVPFVFFCKELHSVWWPNSIELFRKYSIQFFFQFEYFLFVRFGSMPLEDRELYRTHVFRSRGFENRTFDVIRQGNWGNGSSVQYAIRLQIIQDHLNRPLFARVLLYPSLFLRRIELF